MAVLRLYGYGSNQKRQIVISNLAVNTVYTIGVSANNNIGEGSVTKGSLQPC